jgi:hypothetical protein
VQTKCQVQGPGKLGSAWPLHPVKFHADEKSCHADEKSCTGITAEVLELTMSTCDVCGNEYDKAFTVQMSGKQYTFDSFECAIHALAPPCDHCGCRVVGHGVEENGVVYCCAFCASQAGVPGLRDRA